MCGFIINTMCCLNNLGNGSEQDIVVDIECIALACKFVVGFFLLINVKWCLAM